MSGICGVVARRGGAARAETLEAMIEAAPHRSSGAAIVHGDEAGWVAMTTRAGADQPVPYVDPHTDALTVVHARLDNVAEVRRSLGSDAPPAGLGPAALVGSAYRVWGELAFGRLIGDFACAVWDRRQRRLVLARDPMAMRPLYYRAERDRVLFASEVVQLLAVPGVPDAPDERMVAAYLAGSFGDLAWTFHAGVAQVPPSHVVVLDPGSVRVRRFWDIDPEHRITHSSSREYAEHLRELYVEAVRDRLAPGQPAGVLLSGGIDSGAAASAAGWLIENEGAARGLHSYSWDFGTLTQCDERHISRHIIDRFGVAASDVFVEDAGPFSGYPDHQPHPDDPFHGHFQTMLDRAFSLAAADEVGPLFTGMRGDLAIGPVDEDYETLLAHGRFAGLAGELRRHRQATGEALGELLREQAVPAAAAAARGSRTAAWLRWAIGRSSRRPAGPPRQGAAQSLPPWIDPRLARRVALTEIVGAHAETVAPPVDGPLRRRRYEWLFMPMHLRWAVSHERRAASFGLDAVDAWSDRRIAEFCVAIPQQVIQQPGSIDKTLARQALVGVAPAAFLRTADKIVPGPLYVRTLRTSAVPVVRELLTDSRAEQAGWLRAAPLWENYERFVAGGPLAAEFWWALSLEWWLRVREGAVP